MKDRPITKGDRVRVSIRERNDVEGVVFWIGASKHTGGMRYGVRADHGETIWADEIDVERGRPPPAASVRAGAKPGVMIVGSRVKIVKGQHAGVEGDVFSVTWSGGLDAKSRVGVRDDREETYFVPATDLKLADDEPPVDEPAPEPPRKRGRAAKPSAATQLGPVKVDDEVVAEGRVVRVVSVSDGSIEFRVKEGRRHHVKRATLEQLRPVGYDSPHGEGEADIEGVADVEPPAGLGARIDFDRVLAGGTFLSRAGEVDVRVERIGQIALDDAIVAGDPMVLTNDEPALVGALPPGKYEAVVAWGRERVAAAALMVRGARPTRWTPLADEEGRAVYGVDAGMGCFVDRSALGRGGVRSELVRRAREATRPFLVKDDRSVAVAVAFPSGFGDGAYPSFLGHDGERAVAVVTDFGVLYDACVVAFRFAGVRTRRRARLVCPFATIALESYARRIVLRSDASFATRWVIDGEAGPSVAVRRDGETHEIDLWEPVPDDAELELSFTTGAVPFSPVR